MGPPDGEPPIVDIPLPPDPNEDDDDPDDPWPEDPECTETPVPAGCKAGDTASCPSCKKKKRQACDECKNQYEDRKRDRDLATNRCLSDARTDSTLNCSQGMLPVTDRRTATGAVMVGPRWEAAWHCYEAEGSPDRWPRTCPTAFDKNVCHMEWSLGGIDSVCEPTAEWQSCNNAYLAGDRGFEGTFKVHAGVDWDTPIGIKVGVGGEYAGMISWAPSEGTLARCQKTKALLTVNANNKATQCKARVNSTFRGGRACAF